MSRVDTVRDRTAKVKKQVAPRAAGAREAAAEYADKVVPKVEAARDAVTPHLETARERVRDDVLPKVAATAAAAMAASEPVREEARSRGSAALAALKGELTTADVKRARRRSSHRVRKMFIVLGLAGAVAGAVTWLKRQRESQDGFGRTDVPTLLDTDESGPAEVWAPSDTDAAVVNAAETGGPLSADTAGASVDELVADESERSLEEHASSDGWRSK